MRTRRGTGTRRDGRTDGWRDHHQDDPGEEEKTALQSSGRHGVRALFPLLFALAAGAPPVQLHHHLVRAGEGGGGGGDGGGDGGDTRPRLRCPTAPLTACRRDPFVARFSKRLGWQNKAVASTFRRVEGGPAVVVRRERDE